MMRLIASTVLELLANAIGLLVAYLILRPNMEITVAGFVLVVVIFSVCRFVLAPLMMKLSMRYARMLVGGISLVVIFVSLLVTSLVAGDNLIITGVTTWILATLIVWVFGVVAMLLLPLVIFKKTLAAARNDQRPLIG